MSWASRLCLGLSPDVLSKLSLYWHEVITSVVLGSRKVSWVSCLCLVCFKVSWVSCLCLGLSQVFLGEISLSCSVSWCRETSLSWSVSRYIGSDIFVLVCLMVSWLSCLCLGWADFVLVCLKVSCRHCLSIGLYEDVLGELLSYDLSLSWCCKIPWAQDQIRTFPLGCSLWWPFEVKVILWYR